MNLISFIVCDDIRHEFGNKISIMGIYDDSIEFLVKPGFENIWPKKMRLGIYIKLGIRKGEKTPHAFCLNAIQSDESIKVAEGKLGKIKKEGSDKITMSLVFGSFILKEGKMAFKLDLLNDNNELVQSIEPNFPIYIKERVTDVMVVQAKPGNALGKI